MRVSAQRLVCSTGLAVLVAAVAFLLAPDGGGLRPDAAEAQAYQPDLIVEDISDAQQPFSDCTTPAGVKVVVRNIGTGPAPPSTTRVSPTYAAPGFLATPALLPNEAVTLYSTVQGIPSGDNYTAQADYFGDVAESNETNNSYKEFLSLATLPTCTPTPTVTPPPTEPPPTPTPPPPVGGISRDADANALPLETSSSSGTSGGLVAGVIAGIVAAAVALGGAACYARGRARR